MRGTMRVGRVRCVVLCACRRKRRCTWLPHATRLRAAARHCSTAHTPTDAHAPCRAQGHASEVQVSARPCHPVQVRRAAPPACRLAPLGHECMSGGAARCDSARSCRICCARPHAASVAAMPYSWLAPRAHGVGPAAALGSLCIVRTRGVLRRVRYAVARLRFAAFACAWLRPHVAAHAPGFCPHLRRAACRCHGPEFHNRGGVEAEGQGEVRARAAASQRSSRACQNFEPGCLHGIGAVVHGWAKTWSGACATTPCSCLVLSVC